MHQLDRLLPRRLGRLFQVELLGDRDDEHMVSARLAARDQRFEHLFHILPQQLRDRHAVHRLLAVRVFVRGIGDLMLLEHAHHIGFI